MSVDGEWERDVVRMDDEVVSDDDDGEVDGVVCCVEG